MQKCTCIQALINNVEMPSLTLSNVIVLKKLQILIEDCYFKFKIIATDYQAQNQRIYKMLQTDNLTFNNHMNFDHKKTPNRNRPPTYNQTIMNHQYNSREDARSLSPNKLNATKKPTIGQPQRNNSFLNKNHLPSGGPSTQRNQRGVENYSNNRNKNFDRAGDLRCQNHPSKIADFTAFMEGQQLLYCQKCAINVASNGFEVVKTSSQSPKSNITNKFFLANQRSKLQPFNFPEFSSYEGYEELRDFVFQLDGVHSKYQEQRNFFNSIEQHYEKQFNLTESFYEDLMRTLQQMKEDHLNDLVDMSKKHIQLGYIKQDHLKNDVEEMEVIRNDIIDSLGIILQNFRDPETDKNLAFYKQQIYAYSEKIEEEKIDFEAQIINYQAEELEYRLKLIQEYLLDVWEIKPNQNKNQRRDSHHPPNSGRQNQYNSRSKEKQALKSPMNNIIHLGNGKEPKKQQAGTACRRLFEDDELDRQFIAEQTSPQFKVI